MSMGQRYGALHAGAAWPPVDRGAGSSCPGPDPGDPDQWPLPEDGFVPPGADDPILPEADPASLRRGVAWALVLMLAGLVVVLVLIRLVMWVVERIA